MRKPLKNLIFSILSFALLTSITSCLTSPEHPQKQKQTVTQSVKKNEINLSNPLPFITEKTARAEIDIGEPHVYKECYNYFSKTNDNAKDKVFPFDSEEAAAPNIVGCSAEIYQKEADGTRYIGFASRDIYGNGGRDLRFQKYNSDGSLAWEHTLDRQSQAPNFTANFRSSFLVHNNNGTLCYGTLWEGGTQIDCRKEDSGDEVFQSTLPFWSGLTPNSGDNGFWVSDLTSLTKRYPYNGLEMRYFKLPTIGGHSAAYASSPDFFFFASSRKTPSSVTAVRFKDIDQNSFNAAWQTQFKGSVTPSYSYVFPEFGIAIFKSDNAIFALNIDNGKLKWVRKATSTLPPFVLFNHKLYLLMRDGTEQRLLGIDPQTGAAIWKATVPSAILTMHATPGGLFLKSVRAIQKIGRPNPIS